jgi:hypothetical protein
VGGGQALRPEGHFSEKKGHLKFFGGDLPPPPGISEIPQNFPIWYIFPKLKKFSENNIDLSFKKGALGKKCNLNEFFSRKKRALCNRKKGTCQNLGGMASPAPPRFLRPCICLHYHCLQLLMHTFFCELFGGTSNDNSPPTYRARRYMRTSFRGRKQNTVILLA